MANKKEQFVPSAEAPIDNGVEVDRPDLRADLEADFSSLKEKEKMLDSRKITAKNKIKNSKLETLRKVFGMMEDANVDPNSPESIRGFLLELEESDPDLVKIFEDAINSLSPEDQMDLAQMGDAALPGDMPAAPAAAANISEDILPPDAVPEVPTETMGETGDLADRFKGIRGQLAQ